MNLLNALKDLYSYLTSWNITFIILLKLGYLKDYYYDIFYLSLYISFCSFIFTYIHPKKLLFKIDSFEYLLEGKELIFFDILNHHLPLVYLFSQSNFYPKKKYYLFTLVSLLYKVMMNDNYERYGLKDKILIPLNLFVLLFYFTKLN